MQHIKIENFNISKDDIFIIDTNIWIFMLNVITLPCSKDIIEKYSNFIDKIKENGNKIVILSMGISELFNRYMKESGNIYLKMKGIKTPNAYKEHYRPSINYEKDKKFIIQNIQDNILTIAEIVGDCADQLDIDKFLDKKRKNYDFNDNFFACFAEKFNYKIITYDYDFVKTYTDYDFTVITL